MIDFDPKILSEHKSQLQAYGVIPGYALRLQQQKPVTVIQVDHTELAFEYDLAKRIFVEEIASS
jgi:Fe2+ transport system protein FeoA